MAELGLFEAQVDPKLQRVPEDVFEQWRDRVDEAFGRLDRDEVMALMRGAGGIAPVLEPLAALENPDAVLAGAVHQTLGGRLLTPPWPVNIESDEVPAIGQHDQEIWSRVAEVRS
jgi:crotonobetainyl-CoA:carnitine CoA-transferase CaiB-like acyl-CoA transferase